MEADHPQQKVQEISTNKIEQNNPVSTLEEGNEGQQWVNNVYSYVPLYSITLYDYNLQIDQEQNKFVKAIPTSSTSQSWLEVPLGQTPIDDSFAYIRLKILANQTADTVQVKQATSQNSSEVTAFYIDHNLQTNTYQIVGSNVDFENIQSYSYVLPVTSIFDDTLKYDWRSAQNMIGYKFGIKYSKMPVQDPNY